ncbi:MAG: ABC transporter ATP-binding protein [Armatimonadetes bacterium]|nr:ABC transporter ATP-binding protein [Armatimonadota bacterium]NCO91673.1 ABC transporter ATP-binding protein [Armatimonadota bacterium]NCP30811.1 ABC transporter ATP-binding protein [Armatimonadota bacterium]NDK11436.1 ABC transporter ATP-binding protein [Armatimonadota bacterium]
MRMTLPAADTAIEVRDVVKRYRLYHYRPASLKRAVIERGRTRYELVEALKGLTFTVRKGESVAVIGSNASGKSSLLALLARVYRPTSGTITVTGRVATMLELSGGFHPDVTGLENIQFMGPLLGIGRREMERRAQTITDFAELGEYIDAPVRTYSSGMIMRLGFSIAVHADPDVLLIDEVLAVGDESFQHKCYAKLEELLRARTTIVFVSHDMAAVRRICRRTLWLDQGVLAADGGTEEVVEEYLRAVESRGRLA